MLAHTHNTHAGTHIIHTHARTHTVWHGYVINLFLPYLLILIIDLSQKYHMTHCKGNLEGVLVVRK